MRFQNLLVWYFSHSFFRITLNLVPFAYNLSMLILINSSIYFVGWCFVLFTGSIKQQFNYRLSFVRSTLDGAITRFCMDSSGLVACGASCRRRILRQSSSWHAKGPFFPPHGRCYAEYFRWNVSGSSLLWVTCFQHSFQYQILTSLWWAVCVYRNPLSRHQSVINSSNLLWKPILSY